MTLELTESTKIIIKRAHDGLKSADRRLFMASVVTELGRGWHRKAERELGWNQAVQKL